jgi:hypothetical protein
MTANRTFWPSCLTPRATSKEIEVDFLSIRTRTTVPSRMSRMIGSPAKRLTIHNLGGGKRVRVDTNALGRVLTIETIKTQLDAAETAAAADQGH